jgi:CDP-glycerol glycerophosphotransferase (TagB/SpsB family)
MPRFDDVLAEANVYVCDNSSTIYEFAALNRPVVVLNASYYRRDVHHGLRFWEDVPGIQVNKASDLQDAIQEAVENDTFEAERKRITEKVYPYLGQSAERAAQAIESFVRPSSSR